MKTIRLLVLLLTVAMLTACTDKKAEEEKARRDADAKARADAARKEMETLPPVFRSRYDGKRLQPEAPKTGTTTTTTEPTKKP